MQRGWIEGNNKAVDLLCLKLNMGRTLVHVSRVVSVFPCLSIFAQFFKPLTSGTNHESSIISPLLFLAS